MSFKSPEKQLSLIKRGTDNIISEPELIAKLKKSAETNTPLRIKAGFDPTAPDLHLGHCVLLKKLRDFQGLGHTVIFLIGNFTAQIGDPSGKTETRPPLSDREVADNAKTYEKQVFKILKKEQTKVVFNSKWMKKMEIKELLSLTSIVNIARLLERDDFSNRYKSGKSISLKEFLYPLIQAYDSVKIEADVEIGGTDQVFNILMGRDFQKHFGQEPQVAILLPILEGLDGMKKMSKSLDNYIGIEEDPVDVFGKIMSVSDDLMWKYYDLFTNKSNKEIDELKKIHPMDAKNQLAFEITSWLNDKNIATGAKSDFEAKFSRREFPNDARKEIIDANSINNLIDLVLNISTSLKSRGEAKRLISQGGLTINGNKYIDFNSALPDNIELEVKIGKKEFVKVIVNN